MAITRTNPQDRIAQAVADTEKATAERRAAAKKRRLEKTTTTSRRVKATGLEAYRKTKQYAKAGGRMAAGYAGKHKGKLAIAAAGGVLYGAHKADKYKKNKQAAAEKQAAYDKTARGRLEKAGRSVKDKYSKLTGKDNSVKGRAKKAYKKVKDKMN